MEVAMAKRGRKAHAWTAEEDEALRSLTLTAMHERFGIAVTAITARRLELGVAPHKRGRKPKPRVPVAKEELPDLTAKLVGQLMESGGSPSALADRLNVSKQAVEQRVRSARVRAKAARGEGVADLYHQKFGRLTAVLDSGRDEGGSPLWVCKCKCGNGLLASADALTSGAVDSCGCLAWAACPCGGRFADDGERLFCDGCRDAAEEALKDWTDRKFDRLTVLRRGPNAKWGQRTWICRCRCGNETRPIIQGNLDRGYSRSCGCLQKEVVSQMRQRMAEKNSQPQKESFS